MWLEARLNGSMNAYFPVGMAMYMFPTDRSRSADIPSGMLLESIPKTMERQFSLCSASSCSENVLDIVNFPFIEKAFLRLPKASHDIVRATIYPDTSAEHKSFAVAMLIYWSL